MKLKWILACAGALYLSACSKDLPLPAAKEPAKEVTSQTFTPYKILKGQQYCDKSNVVPVKASRLTYKVRFDSSAIYKTSDAGNQRDINKLFGFTDNNSLPHDNSARFGWRWSDGALRLFAYTYNNGFRSFKELGPVPLGEEINCSITVAGDKYVFELDGVKTMMPRGSNTPTAEGYLLFPYFGGDESAPHDIVIWMKAETPKQ